MAYNFLPCDRNQAYLLHPSLTDWLPEDHLAWFVLDAVEQIDLLQFYKRYRADGVGNSAFQPSMMVALLVYSYCTGERSSRKIINSEKLWPSNCHRRSRYRITCRRRN
jgi:transposase